MYGLITESKLLYILSPKWGTKYLLLGHYGRVTEKKCMILRIESSSVKCSSGHDMAITVTNPQQDKIKLVKIPTRIGT